MFMVNEVRAGATPQLAGRIRRALVAALLLFEFFSSHYVAPAIMANGGWVIVKVGIPDRLFRCKIAALLLG